MVGTSVRCRASIRSAVGGVRRVGTPLFIFLLVTGSAVAGPPVIKRGSAEPAPSCADDGASKAGSGTSDDQCKRNADWLSMPFVGPWVAVERTSVLSRFWRLRSGARKTD